MNALLFAVAFFVVAVLVYMARYSGRLHVVQTRVIDAPIAETYAHVVDLRCWPGWSPWLEHGQGAHYSTGVDAPGSSYRWTSDGAEMGTVEHLRMRGPGRIEQRLRLARPFPLRGISSWQVAECDGGTRVTWTLRGRVAFSMRAFAATVQGALALDFRYGLDRLAGLVEGENAARYAVRYEGIREFPAIRYAYIEHTGRIGDQARAMHSAAGDLRAALARQGVLAAGRPMALYLKTSIKQRRTTCRFCIPIGDADVDGVAVASLPQHRAFVTSLRGSREQLELAWYLAMQQLSVLALQPELRITPSERYLDDLDETPGIQERTELLIPVRSI
jgi:hypothetical protein